MTLLMIVLMSGLTTSWAQTEGLRDIASAKNEDGTWKYPVVRADLTILKDKQAVELFHVEQRAVLAETYADSLGFELMVANASGEKSFLDNFEFGILAGTALTVLAAWGMGQVSK